MGVGLVFEEEAASWEEKLNRIHVLFGLCPSHVTMRCAVNT